MRTRHILRMQQGHCSIEAGFVLSDLLTDLERTSDHCSNIAGCVIDARAHNLNLHETLRQAKTADGSFQQTHESYVEKYQLPVYFPKVHLKKVCLIMYLLLNIFLLLLCVWCNGCHQHI